LANLAAVTTLREIVTLRSETGEAVELAFTTGYNDLLAVGTDEHLAYEVPDEADAISVNYASGTTGAPKGVVYTHRGGYLNSLGEAVHQGLVDGSSNLWTLPMFHCNGWCTNWALTAVAGTHVCLRAPGRTTSGLRAGQDDRGPGAARPCRVRPHHLSAAR